MDILKKHGIVIGMCCLVAFVMLTQFKSSPERLSSTTKSYFKIKSESPETTLVNPGFLNKKVEVKQDKKNLQVQKKIVISSPPKRFGQFRAQEKMIPIATTLKVALKELLSNTNYGQKAHAEVIEPLVIDGVEVLSIGDYLSGNFIALNNDSRLYIQFNKVTRLNGESFTINAAAFDLSDQRRGLIAQIDQKVGQRLLKGMVQTAGYLLSAATASDLVASAVGNTTSISLENIETERHLWVEPQVISLFFDEQITIKENS